MSGEIPARSLKGTWRQALGAFFLPILVILAVRWAVFEPYVIPSGSMIPNLLVHDHIFVGKFAYGLRLPFSDRWLLRWSAPRRGEIVVFRYPRNPEMFYVKRLVGLPGDRVRVFANHLEVNGQALALPGGPVTEDDEGSFLVTERAEAGDYLARWRSDPREADPAEGEPVFEAVVEDGRYLFMGDNRDESSDSRAWGTVPGDNLMGPAWRIWLSCDEMLESSRFICDPATIRWSRMFLKLQ